ncbi:MAG: DUF4105 domain-containing protein [Elusimicrobia bacterium]|nr:DUF4105 domain-containing protein [Elusimicrobiota bacterium]
MKNRRLFHTLTALLSVAPLFSAAAYAGSALEELPGYSAEDLRGALAPAPLLQETYPDYVQDRKPASLVSGSGDVRVIGGVRFELQDRDSQLYAWREARIDMSQLDEAYWGYRSGGVGHSYLMFTFKDGAESAGRPMSGLVIEALPWEKKGEPYLPFTAGIRDHYPLVWNVVSWDSFLETSRLNKYTVDVYPLKLSREEKLRLLDEGIKEATRDHSGEKYHTFLNSCSTNALKVFTSGTGHHLYVAKMLPSILVKHLKLRGFLGQRLTYAPSGKE